MVYNVHVQLYMTYKFTKFWSISMPANHGDQAPSTLNTVLTRGQTDFLKY